MKKRVFLIVLDSLGIGEAPDASLFGDAGSNTLGSIRRSSKFSCPNLEKLGLFHIDGVGGGVTSPLASFARMREASMGKDTTIGHWEIAGLISKDPLPTYPNGFPEEVISEFEALTNRGVLCNRPYSGTDVIRDYGEEHLCTGNLIVYTSADSVFQIAAHEDVVPLNELYRYCEIARKMLVGKHGVGRVIARPFAGKHPFVRTSGRHDYSITPPAKTMVDVLAENGLDTIPVGKIYDIFAGLGFERSNPTASNEDGMQKTLTFVDADFCGLCFVNLVDFDSVYGHRNDVDGYAAALSAFDRFLGEFLPKLRQDDLLLITADHGCDPATPSTDHSREYTPLLLYGDSVKRGINLGTRPTFADIGTTVLDYFGLPVDSIAGESLLPFVGKKGEI
ncbi:MAG: phosphopentomutase [Clostridia bacterium]|nr:phosphopentomutase [Clostridia bacterium]